MNSKDPLLIRLFKSYVSKGLEEKIVLTELHYVTTFLHPNLKSLNMITVEEKQKTIRAVKALLITLGINTIEPEMEESIPLPKKNRLNISQQFMDRAKKKDEVIVYERAQIPVIGNDQCILKWWMNNGNMFPSVQSLAYKILPIPASSATSERIFSTSGRILEARRSSLDPSNVDNIICL